MITVAELIELLQKHDPNAKVFFQSSYDFYEYTIDEVIEDNGAVILL